MERVLPGLPADFTRDGGTYKLEVTKPYPEVKEGQFRTDRFHFGAAGEYTCRTNLSYQPSVRRPGTSDPLFPVADSFKLPEGGGCILSMKVVNLPRGVLVKIGRQNPQYYEVTEGLSSGEKVIISGYELFGDNEKLILK